MLYLGVDSVDSASYEWFARYGHIQLPGKGRINITGYAHEKCSEHRTINWKEYECDCPICFSTPKHELLSIFRKSKDARTIHNLHVHAKEMELARERIKENSYELFVEKRFEGTQFYKLFKYAKRLKNNFH
jgi:tRNA-guanine family transglycosylase